MFKWCALFLILTVGVGFYWAVMTGTWADRNIAMQLRAAIKEPTMPDIAGRLQSAQEAVDGQQAMVKNLAFLARNPDWSHVKATRQELKRLLAVGGRTSGGSDEAQADAAEALRAQLRDEQPLTVETFYPQQRTFWTVLFWVFAVPAGLFGLLSVVRASPN
jgi:hypothetical protein